MAPTIVSIISIFVSVSVFFQPVAPMQPISEGHLPSASMLSSTFSDVIAISDTNPSYSILGSSAACFYTNDASVLKPLLIFHNKSFSEPQHRFLREYATKEIQILSIGDTVTSPYHTLSLQGSPVEVSIQLATYLFSNVSSAIIIPIADSLSYELGLQISPLASYLHIPILFYDDDHLVLQETLDTLQISTLYLIGNVPSVYFTSYQHIALPTSEKIQGVLLSVIKERFGTLRYITLTNPSDIITPTLERIDTQMFSYDITSIQCIALGKLYEIQGLDTIHQNITVPSGIVHLTCHATITSLDGPMTRIPECTPVIYMTITDPTEDKVSYSQSSGYDNGRAFGFTFIVDKPGTYTVVAKVFHGFRGGFFSHRGISIVDAQLNLTVIQKIQETAHFPLVPLLSMNAPYLTSAHGGILLGSDSWQITTNEYPTIAQGLSTGPWYNETLHEFNNEKVNQTISCLLHNLSIVEENNLLEEYLSGPAWLAIMADTNMIPMYYYQPSQSGLLDKGLPSDNPYSLNHSLSVGRIIGYDVSDVSVLLCRTFFYEQLCGNLSEDDSWHNSFSFIFGEGYGETGGIFHQIPYSREITKYGFSPIVYGDFRNSRQAAERLGTYTNSNYIEYLGHGDWFWFTPSLYGMNLYGQAIDVAHAKEWIYKHPSVFLTSACLMGRIDGLYPYMNIGLTMLHAGCNAFVGSTRETGQESGLTTLENHLIVDNLSLGEALRGEKQIDQEIPTYYVRTLYGDPAFNPYEPNNGFNNQGRPMQG